MFLENREHQAVFLATEFRRIEQGSSSILCYFARLKDCADHLADLGEHVGDREQVLNMFRGLHPRLRYAVPILTMQTPFPSFLRCRAFLLLEESRLAPESSNEMALHAARAPNSGGGSSTGGNTNRRPGGNAGRNKGKGKDAVKPSCTVQYSCVKRVRERRLLSFLVDQGFHGAFREYAYPTFYLEDRCFLLS